MDEQRICRCGQCAISRELERLRADLAAALRRAAEVEEDNAGLRSAADGLHAVLAGARAHRDRLIALDREHRRGIQHLTRDRDTLRLELKRCGDALARGRGELDGARDFLARLADDARAIARPAGAGDELEAR